MILQGRLISLVGNLEPRRNGDGSIETYAPQSRYGKAGSIPLHQYGRGEFCTFGLPSASKAAGVYVMRIGNDIEYVGEAQSLRNRLYAYGHISPKNCFVGGRQTNCRINKLILSAVHGGQDVQVWFHACDDRKSLEADLLLALQPPWNR